MIDFNQSRCLSHRILIYRELFRYLYLLSRFLHSSHRWLVAHHWTGYDLLHFAAGHRTRLFPLQQRLMSKQNWWEESAWHILTWHNQPIAHRFPLKKIFFMLLVDNNGYASAMLIAQPLILCALKLVSLFLRQCVLLRLHPRGRSCNSPFLSVLAQVCPLDKMFLNSSNLLSACILA